MNGQTPKIMRFLTTSHMSESYIHLFDAGSHKRRHCLTKENASVDGLAARRPGADQMGRASLRHLYHSRRGVPGKALVLHQRIPLLSAPLHMLGDTWTLGCLCLMRVNCPLRAGLSPESHNEFSFRQRLHPTPVCECTGVRESFFDFGYPPLLLKGCA